MKLSRIIEAEGSACVTVACIGASLSPPILWFGLYIAGVAAHATADALRVRGW